MFNTRKEERDRETERERERKRFISNAHGSWFGKWKKKKKGQHFFFISHPSFLFFPMQRLRMRDLHPDYRLCWKFPLTIDVDGNCKDERDLLKGYILAPTYPPHVKVR